MTQITITLKVILNIIVAIIISNNCYAHVNAKNPLQMVWPFEGMFGSFDRQSAQRGAQVYLEVCSTCHGLNHLYYRNLSDLGFTDLEIKEIAGNKLVLDGPDESGRMFERKAVPSDVFVSPYSNEESARAANNGAYPANLSLIVKARPDGANYLYSLLTGYQEETPHSFKVTDGLYYNPYFEGKQLAMPPPLSHEQIKFIDGTPATIEQMARDVTIFLQWTAEPEMERRKYIGLKVMIFLVMFTVFFILVKNKIWKDIK